MVSDLCRCRYGKWPNSGVQCGEPRPVRTRLGLVLVCGVPRVSFCSCCIAMSMAG